MMNGRLIPEATGLQLVAAVFCRDVIYDDDLNQILSMRILHRYRPSAQAVPDFDEEMNSYRDLWFLVIVSNVPQLMKNPDDPNEEPPEEMAIGVRAINPDGEVGFRGRFYLYPEGPLGVASFQVGWNFPVNRSGVLAVELDYLGRHLTTAYLEIEVEESVGPGESEDR